ncbi:MAG: copper resistance protein CopC [Alphaproteobacteria bacterium]|nr:copper resistance protein CopC [Alphaproteobacteria bacterium]
MASLRSIMAGMAVALLAMSLQALPAAAHSPLISSSPADGDVLAAAPQAIEMKFRGTARLVRLVLTGAQSGEVTLSEQHLMVEKHRHTVALPAITADEYEVRWRALSADGHVVKGSFSFIVSAK